MNPIASYRMHITPLSPIHVGTGESYEPTNYVIEDGVLHEFDTGAVMAALSASLISGFKAACNSLCREMTSSSALFA